MRRAAASITCCKPRNVQQTRRHCGPVLEQAGHPCCQAFGNWEMATRSSGCSASKWDLVARELDNPYLNRWVEQFRKFTGHRSISKNGGGGAMVALLERGGSLAMLGDQDAGSSGLFVDFFGRRASTFKSIALLAMEYKALICVGYARRLEDETLPGGWPRFELGCEEVVDPLNTTGRCLARDHACYCCTRTVVPAPEQTSGCTAAGKACRKCEPGGKALAKRFDVSWGRFQPARIGLAPKRTNKRRS